MSLLWPCALTVLLATLASAVVLSSSDSEPSKCRGLEEFHCKTGGTHHDCLPAIWICNGIKDCLDGSDEDAFLCENYHETAACNLTDNFECSNNSACIPKVFLCDGDKDCPDAEDEANCTALAHDSACDLDRVSCDGGHRCISRIFLCDNTPDCHDETDESHCNCTTGHPFHCADGLRCPPVTALCNGAVDCKDGSDEGGLCDSPCSLSCNDGHCYKTPSGPRCICKDGFRENREGGLCVDIDECSEASPCDHYCVNTKGSYTCMCKNGYELKGKQICKASGNSVAILLFSDHFEVRAMDLATKANWLVYAGKRLVSAVAYDPVPMKAFWADTAGKVYSKSLGGDEAPTLLIRSGVDIVYSMAMDWVGRNLYMADRDNKRIVVCNVDRVICRSLLTRSVSPTAIKLDIAERRVYWTDSELPGVMEANMDGSAVATLATDLVRPNALGIDPPARTLYWLDAETDSAEEYNLDQRSRKVIPALKLVHPFSMAVWEDKLYWSDWQVNSLFTAHKKDGRNMTELIEDFYGHSIEIYHEQMLADSKPERNPCGSSECSHLCLLSPVKPFFTCACPLGLQLSNDRSTCIGSGESLLPTLVAGVESNLYKLEMQEFMDPRVKALTTPDTNFARISDLDYDPVTKDLFICDQRGGKIVKLNLESKQRTTLVRDASRPAGIAVDWARKNLYWVDSMKNTLEVITTDGLYRTKLHLEEMCSGLDVEVSQSAGRVVVACERPNARILSCTRQGAPCTVLASSRIKTPIGMAIDRRAVPDVVYWADADENTVQSVSVDGSNNQLFTVEQPAAVLFSRNQFFLSTVGHFRSIFATRNFVQKNTEWDEIHLNTDEELPMWRHKGHIALTAIDWHLEKVYTDRSYDQFCLANTPCQQLCLEDEFKKKVCGCSTGLTLSKDNRTCDTSLCPDDKFRCPDDGSCIPNIVKCNDVWDCSDGADERPLVCNRCVATSFRCSSGECVDAARVCDGHAHCEDKSDEANCRRPACGTGYSPCLTGNRCYMNVSLCDGRDDCLDGTDELNCPACQHDEFRCADGRSKCLPNSWRCNGITECWDGSDEHNCTEGCKSSEFSCSPAGAVCLPHSRVCDQVMDCPSGDDEMAELCLQVSHGCSPSDDYCTRQCGQAEFTCESNSRCIPHRHVCDGESHCEDASDEMYCQDTNRSSGCDRGQFSCGSIGTCISGTAVCNGVMDCANSEDEYANCDGTCLHNGGCDHFCQAGPAGNRCYCQGGYKLSENGFHCQDVNECLVSDPCEQRCDNSEGGFTCLCGPGYVLAPDAVSCRPAEGGHSRVALISGRELRWLGAGRTETRPLLLPKDTNVTHVQVDHVTKDIVVVTADGSLGVLSKGSLRWTPILSELQSPFFALDGPGRNVYVSQQIRGTSQTGVTVKVCSLHSGVCATVHEAAGAAVPSLAVATEARMLYFCESSTVSPTARIFRARLDGSFKNVILEKGLKSCSHIALDEPKETIYWVDPYLNQLNKAVWTGHSVTMYKALNTPVLNLEVAGLQVQWLFPNGTLQRCRKHSSSSCSPVNYGQGGLAISTDPGVVQEESSVCGRGTCSNLCVTSPDGPLCLCDDVSSAGCSLPKVLRSASLCSPDPCLPGGICTMDTSGFFCRCKDGTSGPNCLVTKVGVHKETNFVTPLVVVLILLLIGASAAGIYYYYRRPLLLFKRKTSSKSEVRFSNPAFGAPKDEIDATLRNSAATATASPLNTLSADGPHGSMVAIDLCGRLNGSGEDMDSEGSYGGNSSRGHYPLV